jgi:hypothetical protein
MLELPILKQEIMAGEWSGNTDIGPNASFQQIKSTRVRAKQVNLRKPEGSNHPGKDLRQTSHSSLK